MSEEYTDNSILKRCEKVLRGVDLHLDNPGLLTLGDLSIAVKIIECAERRKRIHILGSDTYERKSIEVTGDAEKGIPMVLLSSKEYYDALGDPNDAAPDDDDDVAIDDDDTNE